MPRWIDRLFGRRAGSDSAPAPVSPTAATAQVAAPPAGDPIEAMRARIVADVHAGYLDEDAILVSLPDYFEDEIDAATVRREAPALLRAVLAEHAAAARLWPDVTDCDRLDAAFAALDAEGIVARANFTCCMTCGVAEMGDEIQLALDSGQPAHGYVFFHQQDTEAAVEGRGVFLAYCAEQEGEAAALAVGRRVVAELAAHGLAPRWDGSWDHRIEVPLDWKRRRGVARP